MSGCHFNTSFNDVYPPVRLIVQFEYAKGVTTAMSMTFAIATCSTRAMSSWPFKRASAPWVPALPGEYASTLLTFISTFENELEHKQGHS